jgi:hypothetical protein
MRRSTKTNGSYSEILKDPRWQKLRLKIFERDGFKCVKCGSSKRELLVHHRWYPKGDPWDIEDEGLATLCRACHEEVTQLKKTIAEKLDINAYFYAIWMLDEMMFSPEKTKLVRSIVFSLHHLQEHFQFIDQLLGALHSLASDSFDAGMSYAQKQMESENQPETTNDLPNNDPKAA